MKYLFSRLENTREERKKGYRLGTRKRIQRLTDDPRKPPPPQKRGEMSIERRGGFKMHSPSPASNEATAKEATICSPSLPETSTSAPASDRSRPP